jgi:Aspartyl protease
VGHLIYRLSRLAATALFAVAAVAREGETYRVPFHTINGMILLDAVVDGKPASLLLDTGANNTIISTQAAGLATVQLRSLQATKAGTGAEGDCITRDLDLRLGNRQLGKRLPSQKSSVTFRIISVPVATNCGLAPNHISFDQCTLAGGTVGSDSSSDISELLDATSSMQLAQAITPTNRPFRKLDGLMRRLIEQGTIDEELWIEFFGEPE